MWHEEYIPLKIINAELSNVVMYSPHTFNEIGLDIVGTDDLEGL